MSGLEPGDGRQRGRSTQCNLRHGDAALHQGPGQGRGQRRILQLQDRQDTDACQGRISKNLHCAAPLQTPA